MGAVRGPSTVCTAAFLRPAANIHYVRSNQLADNYATDPAHINTGYGAVQMSSAFTANRSSQVLDTARDVDHSFDAISLRSHPSHLSQDYIYNYSPMTGTTSSMFEASGFQGASHLPAHGWSSAAVPVSSELRSHQIPSTSWQNMQQQADVELTATVGSVYSMATPLTCSFSPLQTPMQYSAVSSIGSPIASNTSAIPSPVISPYSPSVGKTYSDSSGSETSRLPVHMQPHYLENLLQLHYLLLASNKLQAARCQPSLGAQRFDSYIPGSVTSATRPTMFDINHMPLSPGGFPHGFPATRFPRFA